MFEAGVEKLTGRRRTPDPEVLRRANALHERLAIIGTGFGSDCASAPESIRMAHSSYICGRRLDKIALQRSCRSDGCTRFCESHAVHDVTESRCSAFQLAVRQTEPIEIRKPGTIDRLPGSLARHAAKTGNAAACLLLVGAGIRDRIDLPPMRSPVAASSTS